MPNQHPKIRHRPFPIAVIHPNQIIRSSRRRVPSVTRDRLDACAVCVRRKALLQPSLCIPTRSIITLLIVVVFSQRVPEHEPFVRSRQYRSSTAHRRRRRRRRRLSVVEV